MLCLRASRAGVRIESTHLRYVGAGHFGKHHRALDSRPSRHSRITPFPCHRRVLDGSTDMIHHSLDPAVELWLKSKARLTAQLWTSVQSTGCGCAVLGLGPDEVDRVAARRP